MSRDPEDEDHSYFIRLEGADDGTGVEPVISRAAFQLHGFGTVQSVRDGHPGFVDDEYLSDISAETTITAVELCTAGLWRRVEGGYEISQDELVQLVVDQFSRMDKAREFCTATGGHEPDPEYPDHCRKCDGPIR